jgi:hypothetical protein
MSKLVVRSETGGRAVLLLGCTTEAFNTRAIGVKTADGGVRLPPGTSGQRRQGSGPGLSGRGSSGAQGCRSGLCLRHRMRHRDVRGSRLLRGHGLQQAQSAGGRSVRTTRNARPVSAPTASAATSPAPALRRLQPARAGGRVRPHPGRWRGHPQRLPPRLARQLRAERLLQRPGRLRASTPPGPSAGCPAARTRQGEVHPRQPVRWRGGLHQRQRHLLFPLDLR